jgi:hypothetical protein
MKNTVVIKAPKEAAKFFNRLLKDKAERKEEIKRKFNKGELKTSS